MKSQVLAIGVLAALLAAACAAYGADLKLGDQFPVVGTPVTVTITDFDGEPESVSLLATYRPNSKTEVPRSVGSFGADGTLVWTPLKAGITTLSATAGEKGEVANKKVAVRFEKPPASGIFILFLAGSVLFGGIALSFRRIFK